MALAALAADLALGPRYWHSPLAALATGAGAIAAAAALRLGGVLAGRLGTPDSSQIIPAIAAHSVKSSGPPYGRGRNRDTKPTRFARDWRHKKPPRERGPDREAIRTAKDHPARVAGAQLGATETAWRAP